MMEPAMDRKRPRPNWLIHCSNYDSDSLVTLNDLDSWKTLFRAAEIRQHSTVLELANYLGEGEVLNIQYHRKCRSIFTMKKALIECLLFFWCAKKHLPVISPACHSPVSFSYTLWHRHRKRWASVTDVGPAKIQH